jgi:phosphoglucosamine mutase
LSLRFGTDGVRGVANAELSPELALALGRAAARRLPGGCHLVGRDTRRSGPMLQAALSAGLASEGRDVLDAGVLPTPALAFLSSAEGRPAAMVSASHNPFGDNGVKLFAPGGLKLAEEAEAGIEAETASLVAEGPGEAGRPAGEQVGSIVPHPDPLGAYVDHLLATLEGRSLGGLAVVLDCAHGAASQVAAGVFARAGCRVASICDQPDGTNINQGCGSTHPQALQAEVRARGADLGLAFDGDADRVIAVDETGQVVDGDHMLAMFAPDLKARGLLPGGALVATVMSNLGLRRAMEAQGIRVELTQVGDRHILDALEERGLALGGEQSGHVVFRHLATTGDGLLTGLALADLVRRRGQPLSELSSAAMTRLPQQLLNVSVTDPAGLEGARRVWERVRAEEEGLQGEGRILLRPSGTEPLVRVMVEATSAERARQVATRLARAVEEELGRP